MMKKLSLLTIILTATVPAQAFEWPLDWKGNLCLFGGTIFGIKAIFHAQKTYQYKQEEKSNKRQEAAYNKDAQRVQTEYAITSDCLALLRTTLSQDQLAPLQVKAHNLQNKVNINNGLADFYAKSASSKTEEVKFHLNKTIFSCAGAIGLFALTQRYKK